MYVMKKSVTSVFKELPESKHEYAQSVWTYHHHRHIDRHDERAASENGWFGIYTQDGLIGWHWSRRVRIHAISIFSKSLEMQAEIHATEICAQKASKKVYFEQNLYPRR